MNKVDSKHQRGGNGWICDQEGGGGRGGGKKVYANYLS